MIRTFRAKHQRTVRERRLPPVLEHARVGMHRPHPRRKINLDYVAAENAVVNQKPVALVCKLFVAPFGFSHAQRQLFAERIHRKPHLSVIRQPRLHPNFRPTAIKARRNRLRQRHRIFAVVLAAVPEKPAEPRDKAAQIRRAARTVEKFYARSDRRGFTPTRKSRVVPRFIKLHFQRIHVEKLIAGKRFPRQNPVVQRALERGGVFRLARKTKHFFRKQRHGDRRARFRVGGIINKIVCARKPLADMHAAHAARDIHFLPRNIFEKRFRRGFQSFVAVFFRKIRHCRIQI